MRAIVLAEFGPSDNLHFALTATPVPEEGQLSVDVKAAAVHLIEAHARAGTAIGGQPLPQLPTIPGTQVAGVVTEVGPGVDEEWLDRRVVASLDSGGYAEQAVADIDRVWELPGHVDFAESTVMLSTGPTALTILELAALTPDDVVLVTAAAGGIGTLLTQCAENKGATVVGLASGAKTAKVRADIVVDYTADDWADTVRAELGERDVTVVLEGVGGKAAQTAYELLTAGGRIVSFGAASGEFGKAPQRDDIIYRSLFESPQFGAFSDPTGFGELVERALRATSVGEFSPRIQPFPLADASDAHDALEARHTAGQVVLIP